MSRIEKRLADLKARQEAGTYTLCPRCGRDTMKASLYTNATSRLADIMVCDECGMNEAKLAWMRNPGTLYNWASLQPIRPRPDFKDLTCEQAWEHIRTEQAATIRSFYDRHQQGEPNEELRFEALETLQGLSQIWLEPFHLRYRALDAVLVVQFKSTGNGMELVAALAEE